MNADRKAVARRTVNIFDRLQLKDNKEASILAMACAFILACSAFKVSEQEAVTAAKNLMVDKLRSERIGHAFAAMKMHLEDDYA